MADFLTTDPKKNVTDPKNLGHVTDYPAHVHKAYTGTIEKDDKGKDIVPDGVLIVAWQGKTPVYNEVRSVADADERKAALADGYADGPQLPKAEKPKDKK